MVCDLVQTYHILNYQELSPSLVAALVLGLPDESRVKMKLSGQKITLNQTLMAMMVDSLQFIAWTKTKEAKNGRYKQKSVLKTLMGEYDKAKDELESFSSVEEFEAYMNGFLR